MYQSLILLFQPSNSYVSSPGTRIAIMAATGVNSVTMPASAVPEVLLRLHRVSLVVRLVLLHLSLPVRCCHFIRPSCISGRLQPNLASPASVHQQYYFCVSLPRYLSLQEKISRMVRCPRNGWSNSNLYQS